MDKLLNEKAENLHKKSIVFDAQAKDPDVFSPLIF
jgi:hypothetical protein